VFVFLHWHGRILVLGITIAFGQESPNAFHQPMETSLYKNFLRLYTQPVLHQNCGGQITINLLYMAVTRTSKDQMYGQTQPISSDARSNPLPASRNPSDLMSSRSSPMTQPRISAPQASWVHLIAGAYSPIPSHFPHPNARS